MRRAAVLALALLLLFTACGKKEAPQDAAQETSQVTETVTWQEQYDLGMRYLVEGNYQEAIIAFTAAIQIDPKQAQIYVGRGDAYYALGDAEEWINLAKADYEEAVKIDASCFDAYIGLANVFIATHDYQSAMDMLELAIGVSSDSQENNETIENIRRRIAEGRFTLAIEEDELLDYNSLPSLFMTDFDKLDAYFGQKKLLISDLTETGNRNGKSYAIEIHECMYAHDFADLASDHVQALASAAKGSSDVLGVEVKSAYDLDPTLTGPTGWMDIEIGDTFAAVAEKLGVHADASMLKIIQIHVSQEKEHPTGFGSMSDEYSPRYNGDPISVINVFFRNEENILYSIVYEFWDNVSLNRVIYRAECRYDAILNAAD